MSMFGINEAEAASVVRSLARETLDDATAREWVARAAWTGLGEPGDSMAGILVATLGAAAALDFVAERRTARELLAALQENGVDEITQRDLDKALARWRPRLAPAAALSALRQAQRVDARLLVPGAQGWPAGVDDLELHAPLALWCRGTDAALAAMTDSIALVGSRASTGYGKHITIEASAGLVDRGYAIVSGAAYGIDGMAHRAALASDGHTIAFLAGGIDRFYPPGHDSLLGRIVETGAVIAELPCGEAPTKWRFLQRNRLIAAASRATVVLEAGWRSGSLNTAGHATALVRPVGAVPGPVTSAASAGCHRLIREFDAVCVTNVDEMAELAPLTRDATVPVQLSGFESLGGGAGAGSWPRDGSSVAGGVRDGSSVAGGVRDGSSVAGGVRDGSSVAGGVRDGSSVAGVRDGSGAVTPTQGGFRTVGRDGARERIVPIGDRPSLELRVLDAMSTRSPRMSVDIAARCGLAVATVHATLGVLQLENKVVERDSGWVVRVLR